MCGIFFSVAKGQPRLPDQTTKTELRARGPDSYQEKTVQLNRSDRDWYLTFASSVLALRGDRVQAQPLQDSYTGSVLCWNGEAWKVDGTKVDGNDAVHVFGLLLKATQQNLDEHHHDLVVQVLSNIAGPCAYCFYDALHSIVYYGRDQLGRRSLLVSTDVEGSITLSSVSSALFGRQADEVSTDGIHILSLQADNATTAKLPWLKTLDMPNQILAPATLQPSPAQATVDSLLITLTRAVMVRVVDIPTYSHHDLNSSSAKVAVLFSGGLDCTLLARIIHDILPLSESVDLRNVAFENPRSMATKTAVEPSPYEICPDRVTGRASFEELCRACPNREWNFVAINVPYSVSRGHKSTVQQLMHPHNTEMDLSIAMALYFAARGIGDDENLGPVTPPCSPRVLLSGLGADELFAGYSRHAAAFSRGGYTELGAELKLDFERIGSRNLGRDDRVISHWGKEVRYPYLDEDFVRFTLELPVWEKCGFRPGKTVPKHYDGKTVAENAESLEPAKMLLRQTLWKLGMPKAASERKRAIQFGARTAKMDIGKGRTKGTQILVVGDTDTRLGF